jgi:hypothetical protein
MHIAVNSPVEPFCPSHRLIFEELERIAPGAPFLSLGQTAFWDEPMKAGVAMCSKEMGFNRPFVAGVHDTDYFAKHPGSKSKSGYLALPHNDTTTKDLWSAAGEFSAIFGSETVITKEILQKSGVRIGTILRQREGVLHDATEAYGWRGVAFAGDQTPVIAETKFSGLRDVLLQTLDWAIDTTVGAVPGCQGKIMCERAEVLRKLACDASDEAENGSLSDYYQAVIPKIFEFVSGRDLGLDVTATTQLLNFNTQTSGKSRFKIVELFVNPGSRDQAKSAYNDALRGGEIYTLDRFGSWAIPFDLVVPGHGRGTIRVAPKAVIIMTPQPLFITTKKPVTNIHELAQAIEGKFGQNCTLVGKAVSLIGMLASEFVFIFHEGASGYVHYSRDFHQKLGDFAPKLNPILRVKYSTWDALAECRQWLKMPTPFVQPFGAEEMSTESFAGRWSMVVLEQQKLLKDLSTIRRPLDLANYLAQNSGASWSDIADRYKKLHAQLENLHQQLTEIKQRKQSALKNWRDAKQDVDAAQHAQGRHWREFIFEKNPSPKEEQDRENLIAEVKRLSEVAKEKLLAYQVIQTEQDILVRSQEVIKAHEQRRDLELELELKRLKLVRQAVTVTKGLVKSGLRPSAWWFPLLCPDGGWFRATTATAEYYLESIQ